MAEPSPAPSPSLAANPAGEHLLRAFMASPAMMAITRLADGVLLDANPAFLEAGALTRAEAIGRPILDLGIWVDDSRRLEYRRLLQANGRVQDFEARFRNHRGLVRDMMLNAEMVVIEGAPCAVVVALDISERRRREREQDALFRISSAAQDATDQATLFRRVHAILGEILSARSFFIALYQRETGIVSFPLWSNVVAPEAPPPRPLGRSLTDYVLLTARPLRLTEEQLDAFIRETGHAPLYGRCASWLAAPLLIGGRAVGVISLQDYDNRTAYRTEDTQLLVFVAEQIVTALQRVENEARRRESQEYFTKSFHASPALMALAHLDTGRIVEANAAFLRASGYGRDEVIGRTSLDLHLWANPAERTQFIERLRTNGAVRGLETVFRTKAGEPRYVLVNADVFELEGRVSMLITAIDLTERHRQEQVQEATYQISRVLLAGGNLDALFAEVHRIIGRLMPARNFYVALLGPNDGLIHFPYFVDEVIASAPPRKPANGLTEYVLQTGQPLLATQEQLPAVLARRGTYTPLERPAAVRLAAPLLIEGKAIGVIAVQDYDNPRAYGEEEKRLLLFVAEQTAAAAHRRQAEDALQRAERQFRGIFENALEGLYQTSADGRFLNANPALARMFGYASPAEMLAAINDVGRQVYVDPRRREDFLRLIQHSDEVTDFESEVLRKDGSVIWVSESVRVIRDAAGAPSHFEGVAIDITARREAARALQAAKDAADAANRAKSHFLASMSHELRTPLNGILGYTQILRRDTTLTPKQKDGLAIIHQSADHLLALINDVLDLAKIEARKLVLHPAEFDLPEFVRAVESVFQPRAREKSLLFETAFAADLPPLVRGDAQRLRQVLFNLLSNAIKFTRHGGVVFSVEPAGGRVRFSVSDSGPGIAPEDQGQLFEPFAQIGDHRLHAEGTGLGLNVSRGIVEQMGGQLRVESRAGWGSRFWFEVPLPAATIGTAGPPSVPRRVTGYAGRTRVVLVADDHPANAGLLVDLLVPLGFEVTTASDGLEAVELARRRRPDLVLMDLRMPRLDGFGAARQICAAFPDDPPRIVGISASAFEPDREACRQAGCVEFLAKPFREEELLAVLERQLGLSWHYAEPPARDTTPPFPLVQHAPSAADAEVLFDLACKGDVVGVRAFAQKLAAQDARLGPFAQGVIELAARFKMKAIRQFVTRYRDAAKPGA
ncbi:MAG: PAS domain S-box protein [Opitutaceae bacterium]|nr:PAS domain S-box protein [Opitutaceae bacterium]